MSAAVSRALADGQITSVDAATGRYTALAADCPTDGQPSRARRLSRGQGGRIVEVVMRCSRCATDFVPPLESLYLR